MKEHTVESSLVDPEHSPVPPSAGVSTSYVYALGRIEARFPLLSLEKEFAQAVGRADTEGQTELQIMSSVLSKPENRYIVRKMCWVMSTNGLDTYVLLPNEQIDFDLLLEAIRPGRISGIDIVVGVKGPIAPPALCKGLAMPIVVFDQIYSFDREMLINTIPRPQHINAEAFQTAAEEVFDRIIQAADNAGSTDEHRALNYLAVRYSTIYAKSAEQYARDFSLTQIEMRSSVISGTRKIVQVILSYGHRASDFREKFSVRVDVTEEFPFLVSKLSPYLDVKTGTTELNT